MPKLNPPLLQVEITRFAACTSKRFAENHVPDFVAREEDDAIQRISYIRTLK